MCLLTIVLMVTCFCMSAREAGPGFTWDHFFRALGEIESGNDLYAVGDIKRAPAEYRSYFYQFKLTREHVERGLGQRFKRAYEGSPKVALGIYQISGRYFLEAFGELPRNPFDLAVQKEAVKKYMRKFAYRQSLALDKGQATIADVLFMAKIHSSGPHGRYNKGYIDRFLNFIKEVKSEY